MMGLTKLLFACAIGNFTFVYVSTVSSYNELELHNIHQRSIHCLFISISRLTRRAVFVLWSKYIFAVSTELCLLCP